jgi:hypothetical protein
MDRYPLFDIINGTGSEMEKQRADFQWMKKLSANHRFATSIIGHAFLLDPLVHGIAVLFDRADLVCLGGLASREKIERSGDPSQRDAS